MCDENLNRISKERAIEIIRILTSELKLRGKFSLSDIDLTDDEIREIKGD